MSDIETSQEIRFKEIAQEVIDPQMHTLEIFRQIVSVLEYWDQHFGPLSKQQEAYAKKVLAWILVESKKHGETVFKGNDWLLPYTAASLWTVALHETVAAGMKKRCSRERSLAKLLRDIPK